MSLFYHIFFLCAPGLCGVAVVFSRSTPPRAGTIHPYLEILEFREDLNYLERCLHEQPDIYQLNTLAKKLSEFMSVQELAAFEGLVGKEIEKSAVPIELPRLIDFAHSADCCVIAKEAVTDFQPGEFLVKNGFIEEG